MFDPTAFDNMKIIIEGYLYDKDLEGELVVVNRDDLINLAKLSREYIISFKLRSSNIGFISSFKLKANLENLAAELLHNGEPSLKQGCTTELDFKLHHKNEEDIFHKLQNGLKQIWGVNREITQLLTFNPMQENSVVENTVTIKFNRIIIEDQVDDLLVMIDHMIETLYWLETNLF